MLNEVQIRGFTSFAFDAVPVKLGPLNVIVGANGSGKSNFLKALRFLQASIKTNINEAISEFGDFEALVNHSFLGAGAKVHTDCVEVITFRVSSETPLAYFTSGPAVHVPYWLDVYLYELAFSQSDGKIVISHETLQTHLKEREKQLAPFQILRRKESINVIDPQKSPTESFSSLSETEWARPYLAAAFNETPATIVREIILAWKFLSLEVDASRSASQSSIGELSVGRKGEKLDLVVEWMKLHAPKAYAKFVEALKLVLPSIQEFEVKRLANGDVLLEIEDEWLTKPVTLPFMSDGTVRLLGLLAQMFLIEEVDNHNVPWLLCIEEPEQQLHPHLLETLVGIFRRISDRVQLIITTHSPTLLDYLEPHEIILCDRIDGATKMMNASKVENIEIFRKNFSLGELWEQGALGVEA